LTADLKPLEATTPESWSRSSKPDAPLTKMVLPKLISIVYKIYKDKGPLPNASIPNCQLMTLFQALSSEEYSDAPENYV
jgi:hypothetical protein